MFNFVSDRIVQNRAYPHGSLHQAEPFTSQWRLFAGQYPYTVPVELHEHCRLHNYPHHLYSIENDYPINCWYAVGLGFFSFDIDYFALMSQSIRSAVEQKRIKILFFYHEGDNPENLQNRLSLQCSENNLPSDCYTLVSGNTAADTVDRCVYWPDHELLYWNRNRNIAADPIHSRPRPYEFTILSRTHKWWRATIMSDLLQQKVLDRSLYSYHFAPGGDRLDECPIEMGTLGLTGTVNSFLAAAPYVADTADIALHNDHSQHNSEFYTQSYCSIVLETLFDCDGSGGAFLTEKTFKCLKHGHPFVIAGGPGSIATLRNLGYRTFDSAIDHSYDQIQNNTQRWLALRREIQRIKQQDMSKWFASIVPDLHYNQQLFLAPKQHRLNTLYERLHLK